MAEVTKLREDAPISKVIATGLNVVIGISNDRQISFQSGYEGDEADASIMARLDRMFMFADKLKARYEIEDLEEQIRKNAAERAKFEDHIRTSVTNTEHALAMFDVEIEEMKGRREAERARKLAEMNAEIVAMQEMRGEHFQNGLAAFRKAGRQGSYLPRGADKANLDRIDLGIERAGEARDMVLAQWDADYDAAMAKNAVAREKRENEGRQEVQGLENTVARYTELITEDEGRLAKRRSVLEG
jgi:hypothetical protein